MGRVRRRFNAKFKEAICQQILSGMEMREVCQEHQLGRQTVKRVGWRHLRAVRPLLKSV